MSAATSFNESDHPRDEGGQFAPKDAPESEASLDASDGFVPEAADIAETLLGHEVYGRTTRMGRRGYSTVVWGGGEDLPNYVLTDGAGRVRTAVWTCDGEDGSLIPGRDGGPAIVEYGTDGSVASTTDAPVRDWSTAAPIDRARAVWSSDLAMNSIEEHDGPLVHPRLGHPVPPRADHVDSYGNLYFDELHARHASPGDLVPVTRRYDHYDRRAGKKPEAVGVNECGRGTGVLKGEARIVSGTWQVGSGSSALVSGDAHVSVRGGGAVDVASGVVDVEDFGTARVWGGTVNVGARAGRVTDCSGGKAVFTGPGAKNVVVEEAGSAPWVPDAFDADRDRKERLESREVW